MPLLFAWPVAWPARPSVLQAAQNTPVFGQFLKFLVVAVVIAIGAGAYFLISAYRDDDDEDGSGAK